MLDTLNFVRGAVAEKDLVPVLTHFRVYNGRIQGSNGRIAIDAPLPELQGYDFTVPADRFLRAVDTCGGEPKLLIKDDKLVIKRGKFTAKLPLADNAAYPLAEPDKGRKGRINIEFLPTMRQFIGQDASRPWASGVLMTGDHAYATNNVVLVRHKIDGPKKNINIPLTAVEELCRIGVDYDIKYTHTDNHVTFYYDDGSWLRSQLFSVDWPDLSGMFKVCSRKVREDVKEAVAQILPFCPDPKTPVIKFGDDGVSTLEGDVSAVVKVAGLTEAYFRAEPLGMVFDIATHFDWSDYPKACPFKSKYLQGVIIGVKS